MVSFWGFSRFSGGTHLLVRQIDHKLRVCLARSAIPLDSPWVSRLNSEVDQVDHNSATISWRLSERHSFRFIFAVLRGGLLLLVDSKQKSWRVNLPPPRYVTVTPPKKSPGFLFAGLIPGWGGLRETSHETCLTVSPSWWKGGFRALFLWDTDPMVKFDT